MSLDKMSKMKGSQEDSSKKPHNVIKIWIQDDEL